MAAYERKNWGLGWIPSDDAINGRRNGLLRMDNLKLDEEGVLSSVRGTSVLQSIGSLVHSCFSKYFGALKYRYIGSSDGNIYRNSGGSSAFDFVTPVLSGGSTTRAFFQDLLGLTVCSSGTQRKKNDPDGGTNYNLGVEIPAQGLVPNVINQPSIHMGDKPPLSALWTLEEGSNFVSYPSSIFLDTDSSSLRAIAQIIYPTPINTIGTKNSENDYFQFSVRPGDSEQVKFVRIEVMLDLPLGGGVDVDTKNYYYHEIRNDDQSPFIRGRDQWSHIDIKRSEFTRQGLDFDKNWDNVYALRAIIVYKNAQTTGWADFKFLGGDGGQLNGRYDWRQSNCYDNGTYVAESPVGPALYGTGPRLVWNGSAKITPIAPTDPQVNKMRFYRRNVDTSEADEYYLVKELDAPFAASFMDNIADKDAADLNIKPNLFLKSFHDLEDEILGMTGLYFERLIVITTRDIIISQPLNIDSYDPRESIRLSGDVAELNLWITKVQTATIEVGTTHDIYELSGTLETLPDAQIDVVVRPIGASQFPPISRNFAVDKGNVFYMAADGWRVTSGSSTELITGELSLLYKGYTRHGVAPVSILPHAQSIYPVCIARGSLWTSNPLTDGSREVFVYVFPDSIKGTSPYWYPWITNPVCLFTEEDGKIIAGYSGALREIDTGTMLDGSTKQAIFFETVYDDNDQPRNRKDTFTLKVVGDSAGDALAISIAKDGTDNYIALGNYTFNGYETKYITIAGLIGLGKRFSLKITGNVSSLHLYEFQLEYDPRPEQLTYLRVPNTNLGTASRKRFVNFPFIIDTLGNNLTFSPLVDGVPTSPTSTVNLNRKGTHIHFFPSETVGIDIGGIISGTDPDDVFEYYSLNLEEILSEKMPVPATFLIIPQDDYGTSARKRFSSYKFVINTRGGDVKFTPHIDSFDATPKIFNTTEKTTVEYYFLIDTFGIDIGGRLESLSGVPFEFYNTLKPKVVEELPERLKYFKIPENNYGIAARKRLRTIPMQINTNGADVIFTPIIDGVPDTATTLNTVSRRTTYHYFNHDVFCTDIAGELLAQGTPFEFYGLMTPENVEVLPVPKKFDQVGPIEIEKLSKIKQIRIRLITGQILIPITIYMEDEIVHQDTLTTTPNEDRVYEIMVPKGTNGTVLRMEIGPCAQPFHRYDVEFWLAQGGSYTDLKRLRIK